MQYFFAIALWCSTLLLPLTTSAEEACSNLLTVKASCSSITDYRNCSRELIDSCCRCQQDWSVSYPFCSFNEAVNPTPTSSLPTPTPTPDPNRFNCTISQVPDSTICREGRFSVVLRLERTQNDSIGSSLECNEAAVRLGAALTGGGVSAGGTPNGPFGNNLAVFGMSEPRLTEEATCVVRVNSLSRAGGCERAVAARACDLGCTSTDVLSTQLRVDDHITGQFNFLKSLTKKLLKIRPKLRKEAKRYIAEGQVLFERGWIATYRYPRIIQDCTNTVQCGFAMLTNDHSDMKSSARALRDLSNRVLSRALRFAPKAQRRSLNVQKMRISMIYDDTIDYIEALPTQRSICG